MGAIGGLLGRLPAAVFVVLALLFLPWLGETLHWQPNAPAVWVGDKLLWDFAAFVALMPFLAGLAFLVGVVFMVAHHHYAAMAAGGLTLAFIVIDLVWHLTGLGAWATGHLAGG